MESGITRVVYRGDVNFDVTTEMIRKVGRTAMENRSSLLLFDIREAGEGEYHASAIKHTELAPSLGIDRSFRTAFLGREGDPRLGYIETVTVNRGFRTKTFTDEAAAVAWLRSGP
jgi:hypothetical protein